MNNHVTTDVAVLFDLDGTFVDSQDAETLALQCFAAQFGVAVLAGEVDDLVAGRRMQEAIDLLCAHIKVDPPQDALPAYAPLPKNSSTGAFDVFPASTPRSAGSTIQHTSYRTLPST